MDDFTRKADEIMRTATNRALAKASKDLRSEVEDATPKGDTGNARRGWKFDRDPDTVDFFGGETLTLKNDEPYAMKLERGASKQAPNGMLAPSLEKLPDLVEAAGREEGRRNG